MALKEYQEFEIASDYKLAKEAEDRLMAEASAYELDEEAIFALRLSLEEALSNAIRHGNKGDKNKKIQIRYHMNAERIDIYVGDEGEGFDLKKVPDPTRKENLEIPSGRGIMLMQAYMNLVEYNKVGNEVHLVKFKQAG